MRPSGVVQRENPGATRPQPDFLKHGLPILYYNLLLLLGPHLFLDPSFPALLPAVLLLTSLFLLLFFFTLSIFSQ